MRALRVLPALVASACGCGGRAVRVGPLDVCAEEAVTAAQRARGLMGHAPLAHGEGMLLVFPTEGEVCIVNRGVSFAIDVVYAAGDGRVAAIERDIPAGDGDLRCHDPARWVLEVGAGQAAGVALGDRMTFP